MVSGQKMEREVQTTRGPAAGFEDLKVFKLAYRLALEVHRASLGFPAVEQYGLADQVRRASKSICANIAEGIGKQPGRRPSAGGFWRSRWVQPTRCGCGCGSCLDLGYIDVAAWQRWRDAYQEVAQMLQGLRRSIGRSAQRLGSYVF